MAAEKIMELYMIRALHTNEYRSLRAHPVFSSLLSLRALLAACRYLHIRSYVDRPVSSLYNEISGMSDDVFRHEFRLTKALFWSVVTRIQDNPVFRSRRRQQRPVPFQLLVFLQYIGFNGSGTSQLRLSRFTHCSIGSVATYVRRCVQALLSLRDSVIVWPSATEQSSIAAAFEEAFGIPDCVGLIDGTLIPLATKPSLYGEDYYTRKGGYAVNTLVVCDHRRVIRYMYTGWPGGAHDQRVLNNSKLGSNLEAFLSAPHFLLGDSAYTLHPLLVAHSRNLPIVHLIELKTHLISKYQGFACALSTR